MKNQNREIENFFSIFMMIMLIIVLFIASFSAIVDAENDYIEPLSVSQQQAIVSQIGIDGFKMLIKNRCYDSIVLRARTNRWNDQYCAKSYRHLNYRKILVGEI